MNRTWIGRHRPTTKGLIVNPGTHLISPRCDVISRQRRMMTIVFVHIIEEVAHALVQNIPLEWFSSTPAG